MGGRPGEIGSAAKRVLLDEPGGKHGCQDRQECESHDEDGIGDFFIEDPAFAASD
jgi:hypothetical protein